MSAVDDTQVREAACDPAHSVLLQAPAGSGKTSVLTQRLLRLLGEADEPEEILAITFTRKAAAEMRARVVGALRGEIALSGAAGERLRALAAAAHARSEQRGWNLLENPARLAIQTIDSFSFRLAAQLPLSARAGGALTLTERPETLYQRAARQTLLAAEADRSLAADIERLLTRLDNQWTHVEALLAAMLAKRAHWLPHVLGEDSDALCARITASLAALTRSQLGAAVRLLPASLRARAGALPPPGGLSDTSPTGSSNGSSMGSTIGLLGEAAETLPAWQQLAALTLTAKGEWRSARGINRTLGAAYGEPAGRERLRDVLEELAGVAGARERLGELAALPPCTLQEEETEALACLSRVLQMAAAQLQTELARAGRVDYTYVSGAARAALADAGLPTDLALRIGYGLRHILVDELQDTSLPQLELLAALTCGWEEGDGRTLFAVGDPMQSIYQFREAEVGLFLKARAQGIGGVRLRPMSLSRNFRSVPALIDWVNHTCAQLFPQADDVQGSAVRFTPSEPGRARSGAADAAPVRLALLPSRPAEGAWVASHIARLRAADPAATIAVLVAARGHARPVLQALAARGIPAIGVDLTPLQDLAVVQDLVALTRALHHPGDRTAWLAVLRAPWCGLPLAALTALAQQPDGGFTDLGQALEAPAALAAPDQERLARVRAVLQGALARRGRQPVGQWLEQTWVQLGGADAYPREDLPHAAAFFAALTESAAGGEWQGPADLEALLAGLHARPAATEGNPVQIMTIHRAKGLEFDHVLLPGLDRTGAADREPLLRWLDLPRMTDGAPGDGPEGGAETAGDSDLLMAPVPALDAQEAGEVGRYLKRLTQRRQQHEQVRLLYVALTRARQSLHLSASPAPRADSRVRPRAHTLLACLWPVLGPAFEVCAPEAGAVPAPRPARTLLRRLTSTWQPAPLPAAVAVSGLPLAPPAAAAVEFSWAGEIARHIGTVAHAALCALAAEPELPGEAAIRARGPLYRAQLRRLGVPAGKLEAAAGEVLQALLNTLADERGRWIFDRGHREAASELALTGLAGGRLVSVVVDRSFVDAQGTRWVLDFKTSRHEGGGLEAFLDREIERYRAQLTRYAALARGLGPEPVRAGLYFPRLQAFRELPRAHTKGQSSGASRAARAARAGRTA